MARTFDQMDIPKLKWFGKPKPSSSTVYTDQSSLGKSQTTSRQV